MATEDEGWTLVKGPKHRAKVRAKKKAEKEALKALAETPLGGIDVPKHPGRATRKNQRRRQRRRQEAMRKFKEENKNVFVLTLKTPPSVHFEIPKSALDDLDPLEAIAASNELEEELVDAYRGVMRPPPGLLHPIAQAALKKAYPLASGRAESLHKP